MPEPAPQQPAQPAAVDETPTLYSLSEAQETDLETLARVAPNLKEAAIRILIHLRSIEPLGPSPIITISTTTLATQTNLAQSAVRRALKELAALIYITVRGGMANRPTMIKLNLFRTTTIQAAKGVPFRGTPPASSRHPVCLFEAPSVPIGGTPPTDSKALTPAAQPLDDFRLENPILDRVLKSKVSDHDPDAIAYFRRWLHGYMARLGRDDRNRRYTDTGATPHPPDNEIVARLLSVAEPHRLMPMLENLMLDARTDDKLQPYSYGWFIYVALSRLAGIHFTATKQAQQQFRVHQRGRRSEPAPPPPAEQPGELFNENPSVEERTDTAAMLRTATAKVKNLR